MHLVQHSQMSWTSFSKLGSPGLGFSSTTLVKIYNKKMLETDLNHAIAFATYLDDKGSYFSWCCFKRPVFGFLPPRVITGVTSVYHFMACLRRSHLKCPHSLSALWYGLQSRGHFQPVYKLWTLQNPKLEHFILHGYLPLCLIYNRYVPLGMCLLVSSKAYKVRTKYGITVKERVQDFSSRSFP